MVDIHYLNWMKKMRIDCVIITQVISILCLFYYGIYCLNLIVKYGWLEFLGSMIFVNYSGIGSYSKYLLATSSLIFGFYLRIEHSDGCFGLFSRIISFVE